MSENENKKQHRIEYKAMPYIPP